MDRDILDTAVESLKLMTLKREEDTKVLHACMREVTCFRDEKSALRGRMKGMDDMSQSLESRLQSMEVSLAQLRQQSDSLGVCNQKALALIAEADKVAALHGQDLCTCLESVSALQIGSTGIQAAHDSLQHQHDTLVQEHANSCDLLRRNVQDCEKDRTCLEAARQQLECLEARTGNNDDRISDLQVSFHRLEDNCTGAHASISEVSAMLNRLESDMGSTATLAKQGRIEVDDACRQMAAVRADITDVSTSLKLTQSEFVSMVSQAHDRATSMSRIGEHVVSLQANFQHLSSEVLDVKVAMQSAGF